MTHYYICSLGQLVDSNWSAYFQTIYKFTNHVTNAWISPSSQNGAGIIYYATYPFALSYTIGANILDNLSYHTIDSYKKGLISDASFRSNIQKQLGISISDSNFDDAWNAMNSLSDKSLSKIINVIKSGSKLIISSSTNKIHYDNFIEQVENKLEEDATKNNQCKSSLSNNDNIIFSLSYLYKENHLMGHMELASRAIAAHNLDQADNHFISLHDKIATIPSLIYAHFESSNFNEFIGAVEEAVSDAR